MKTNEKIKKYRLERGLTQKKLGELCGIAETTVRQYELGLRNPKLETRKKIAAALDIPISELLGIREEKNYSNLVHGEELEAILYKVAKKLSLSIQTTKALFWEVRLPISKEITYENVYKGITDYLDKQPTTIADWYALEKKLELIGYSIETYEEDAFIWIIYPDGTLEINEDDIATLNNETNDFLKFKLEELKKNKIKDFTPKSK